MGEFPERYASLWGCQVGGIASAIDAWKSDWADARALLALSHLLQTTMVVFNSVDKSIEVITAGGGNVAQNQVATLHYREGHYDALKPLTPSEFQNLWQHVKLVRLEC